MNPLPFVVALLSLLAQVTAAPPATPATPVVGASVRAVPHGVWPLRPRPEVVRAFDPPSDPYGSGHRGVDLLGSNGQAVHAALPGTVTYAGVLAGIGVVVIDHGATRTTYQPVTATVPVGAQVGSGAVIGTLVLPGSHCPPASCLHWGWIRNAGPAGPEVYLDPLGLVGLLPMRLLPLDGAG